MKISTIQQQRDGATEAPKGAVALTIEETALEHIIDSLTNIYSRPWQAVVREYVSNALDSHARSGVNKAVQVELAVSGDNGVFTVRDFGSGMTREEIETIYSRYGASLKRDSNTQIGGFGLGAKSALAVVSRFNGVSVSGGKAVHFYVERTPGSPGNLVVDREYPTTDESSFTIQIPFPVIYQRYSDILSAEQWTKIFAGLPKDALDISYTKEGRATEFGVQSHIDSSVAEKFIDPASNATLGWLTRADDAENTLRVVVGGVIYEVRKDIANTIRREVTGEFNDYQRFSDGVILNVPIGTVSFTRSREEFIYDDTTKDSIKSTFERFAALVNSQRIARINELDKAPDVLRALLGGDHGGNVFESMVPLAEGSEWRGFKLPTEPNIKVTAGMAEEDAATWKKATLTPYKIVKQGTKGITAMSGGVGIANFFEKSSAGKAVFITAPLDQMRLAADEVSSIYNRTVTAYKNNGDHSSFLYFVIVPEEGKDLRMWLSEFYHSEATAFTLRDWVKAENKKWRDSQPASTTVRAKRPKAAAFVVTTIRRDKAVEQIEKSLTPSATVKTIAADDEWITKANTGNVFYIYRGVILDHNMVLADGINEQRNRVNHALIADKAGHEVIFDRIAGGDELNLVILSTSSQETKMREAFPHIRDFGAEVKTAASKAFKELPDLPFTGADLDYTVVYKHKEVAALLNFWGYLTKNKLLDRITHPLLQANHTLLSRLITKTQEGPLYDKTLLLSRYATSDVTNESRTRRISSASKAMAGLDETGKMFPFLSVFNMNAPAFGTAEFKEDLINYLNGKA